MVLSSFSMSWGDGTESLARALCRYIVVVAAIDVVDDDGAAADAAAAASVGGVHHAHTHTQEVPRRHHTQWAL